MYIWSDAVNLAKAIVSLNTRATPRAPKNAARVAMMYNGYELSPNQVKALAWLAGGPAVATCTHWRKLLELDLVYIDTKVRCTERATKLTTVGMAVVLAATTMGLIPKLEGDYENA